MLNFDDCGCSKNELHIIEVFRREQAGQQGQPREGIAAFLPAVQLLHNLPFHLKPLKSGINYQQIVKPAQIYIISPLK